MRKITISKRVGIILYWIAALVVSGIILFYHNPLAILQEENLKKIISCVVIFISALIFTFFYGKIIQLPRELIQNRKLIWKLAKNDFKTRYAGSYMGFFWALVQPVVTVLLYYIVFDKIFGDRAPLSKGEVPHVLFLTAGLVPWFFFSEALNGGTMALLEYNYLVKKVVFKISILPIIKVIAATFIHGFFVLVLLSVAFGYGFYPSIYTIQLLYYSFCLFMLVLAITYSTCSIVIFFRDLGQIIAIVLQIGMWATPILWDLSIATPKIAVFLKLNPLVYIVNGYRSAIWGKQWFFEDFFSTMYFWIVTVVLFGIGALIFKRLKVHFADVL